MPADPARIYSLSLADPSADPHAEAARFRPPFAHLAVLIQIPGPDIMDRLAVEKGAPLDEAERQIALERIAAARAWLAAFAPSSARLEIQYAGLPAAAVELDDGQKRFMRALARAAQASAPAGGEAWQALIFENARQVDLPAGKAFGAIYRAFLDRPNGPRAGWLLASLDSSFVVGRLKEAAA